MSGSKRFKTFFLLYLVIFYNSFLTASDMPLVLAEKFADSGNYYDAITEYKRYIFFNLDKGGANLSDVYHKIGLVYRNRKMWKESLAAIRESIQSAGTGAVRDERKIDLAIVLIASGNYNTAEFYLIKTEMFTEIPEIRHKAIFFRGISTIYSHKWELARQAFKDYFSNSGSECRDIAEQVDVLLAKAVKLKYRSPKLAKILSTILPGSGQIYSGDWRNGINALAINIATGYFLVSDILKRHNFSVILNSIFLFQQFYQGNRFHAKESAKRYNRNLNRKFTKHILEILNGKNNEKN